MKNLKAQFSSAAHSCLTLYKPLDCSTPGFPVHHQHPEQLKLMSVESVMPSNHLIFCCPLLLLPLNFPSIRVFPNESVLPISGQSNGVSLSPSSFQRIFKTDFLQDGLVGSSCSPRISQESSPTPQFKSSNSSLFIFLYCRGPAPADPGYSKERRLGEGQGITA